MMKCAVLRKISGDRSDFRSTMFLEKNVMTRLTYIFVLLGTFGGVCAFALCMVYFHIQRNNANVNGIVRTSNGMRSLLGDMECEAKNSDMPPDNMREMLDWLNRKDYSQPFFDDIRRNVTVDLEHGVVFDAWGTPIQLIRVKDSVVAAVANLYVLVSYGPNRRNDGGLPDDIVCMTKIPDPEPLPPCTNAVSGSELSKIIRAIGEK
jgi:hypothetical protein